MAASDLPWVKVPNIEHSLKLCSCIDSQTCTHAHIYINHTFLPPIFISKCPVCAPVLTCLKSKGPSCKQRSSCGCLLCIGFFSPYTSDYILWGYNMSEMDCGLCVFAEQRRSRFFSFRVFFVGFFFRRFS